MNRRDFLSGLIGSAVSLLPISAIARAIGFKKRYKAYFLVGFNDAGQPTLLFQNNTDKELVANIDFAGFFDDEKRTGIASRFTVCRKTAPHTFAAFRANGGEIVEYPQVS